MPKIKWDVLKSPQLIISLKLIAKNYTLSVFTHTPPNTPTKISSFSLHHQAKPFNEDHQYDVLKTIIYECKLTDVLHECENSSISMNSLIYIEHFPLALLHVLQLYIHS